MVGTLKFVFEVFGVLGGDCGFRLHALDHQVNLDLKAMFFCIRTAFWIIGLGLSMVCQIFG